MAKRVKKKFEKIVAPLSKMVSDLEKYLEEKDEDVTLLLDERSRVDNNIAIAEQEKEKSRNALEKIRNLFE